MTDLARVNAGSTVIDSQLDAPGVGGVVASRHIGAQAKAGQGSVVGGWDFACGRARIEHPVPLPSP